MTSVYLCWAFSLLPHDFTLLLLGPFLIGHMTFGLFYLGPFALDSHFWEGPLFLSVGPFALLEKFCISFCWAFCSLQRFRYNTVGRISRILFIW